MTWLRKIKNIDPLAENGFNISTSTSDLDSYKQFKPNVSNMVNYIGIPVYYNTSTSNSSHYYKYIIYDINTGKSIVNDIGSYYPYKIQFGNGEFEKYIYMYTSNSSLYGGIDITSDEFISNTINLEEYKKNIYDFPYSSIFITKDNKYLISGHGYSYQVYGINTDGKLRDSNYSRSNSNYNTDYNSILCDYISDDYYYLISISSSFIYWSYLSKNSTSSNYGNYVNTNINKFIEGYNEKYKTNIEWYGSMNTILCANGLFILSSNHDDIKNGSKHCSICIKPKNYNNLSSGFDVINLGPYTRALVYNEKYNVLICQCYDIEKKQFYIALYDIFLNRINGFENIYIDKNKYIMNAIYGNNKSYENKVLLNIGQYYTQYTLYELDLPIWYNQKYNKRIEPIHGIYKVKKKTDESYIDLSQYIPLDRFSQTFITDEYLISSDTQGYDKLEEKEYKALDLIKEDTKISLKRTELQAECTSSTDGIKISATSERSNKIRYRIKFDKGEFAPWSGYYKIPCDIKIKTSSIPLNVKFATIEVEDVYDRFEYYEKSKKEFTIKVKNDFYITNYDGKRIQFNTKNDKLKLIPIELSQGTRRFTINNELLGMNFSSVRLTIDKDSIQEEEFKLQNIMPYISKVNEDDQFTESTVDLGPLKSGKSIDFFVKCKDTSTNIQDKVEGNFIIKLEIIQEVEAQS